MLSQAALIQNAHSGLFDNLKDAALQAANAAKNVIGSGLPTPISPAAAATAAKSAALPDATVPSPGNSLLANVLGKVSGVVEKVNKAGQAASSIVQDPLKAFMSLTKSGDAPLTPEEQEFLNERKHDSMLFLDYPPVPFCTPKNVGSFAEFLNEHLGDDGQITLAGCGLPPDLIQTLLNKLDRPNANSTVDLSDNPIGDDIADTLAAFADRVCLGGLILRKTRLTPLGLANFLAIIALSKCPTFQFLDIAGMINTITDLITIVEAVKEVVARNPGSLGDGVYLGNIPEGILRMFESQFGDLPDVVIIDRSSAQS
jgi:hypothetical protein